MAKKKRRIFEEPEEEYEFSPTEFNEREFILKDLHATKAFMVCMAVAVVVGIIAAVIIKCFPMESGGYYLSSVIATLISFAVMACLKKIMALVGLHPEMMETKDFAINYLMYLTMALGICIIGVQF